MLKEKVTHKGLYTLLRKIRQNFYTKLRHKIMKIYTSLKYYSSLLISGVHMLKRVGDRTLPCGTLASVGKGLGGFGGGGLEHVGGRKETEM